MAKTKTPFQTSFRIFKINVKFFISLYKKYKKTKKNSLHVQYFAIIKRIYIILVCEENRKDK
jgi:hypothetical protein